MNIFVTGGTGFIGTHVVGMLLDRGHTLRCLARDPQKAQAFTARGATVIAGDLADSRALRDGMRGCEAVVNLANLYEFWVRDRREYARVNVEGTRSVLTAALEASAAKIVHVSSVVVFGDAAWPVTESSHPGPACASEYARTKRSGDEVAWELHARRQLPLVVVYPGGVLGPGDPKASGQYVGRLVRGAMPAQVLTKRIFPWVHVRDVATGIVRAVEKAGNSGERYLLAAENLTFGQINAMVAQAAGIRLPRITFPDWLTLTGACLATGLANLVGKPPVLGLALDQMRTMRQGFEVDGSKARRELGLEYTPIRTAIQEEVEVLRHRAPLVGHGERHGTDR